MSENIQFVQKVKPVYVDTDGNERIAPNEQIPFRETILVGSAANIADNNHDGVDFTQADWGVGSDLFVRRLNIMIESDGLLQEFNDDHGEGFNVEIIDSTTGQYFLREHFNDRGAIYQGTTYRLGKYYPQSFFHPAANTLRVWLYNYSGVQVDFYVYLGVVAIA
jgi:hypothetical protein